MASLDPDQLLWNPDAKKIFIPKPSVRNEFFAYYTTHRGHQVAEMMRGMMFLDNIHTQQVFVKKQAKTIEAFVSVESLSLLVKNPKIFNLRAKRLRQGIFDEGKCRTISLLKSKGQVLQTVDQILSPNRGSLSLA